MTGTDYTYQVTKLQDAYMAMQIAKKTKRMEIQAAHRKTLERSIREAEDEIEREFARDLHAANLAGVPGNVIRADVLRTQDWGRWKKWRDLAQIEPDRVSAQNAKVENARANSPFKWSDDWRRLTVTRTSNGLDLATPVVYDMQTLERMRDGRWIAAPHDEGVEREAMDADVPYGYLKFVWAEITAQVAAENVVTP